MALYREREHKDVKNTAFKMAVRLGGEGRSMGSYCDVRYRPDPGFW